VIAARLQRFADDYYGTGPIRLPFPIDWRHHWPHPVPGPDPEPWRITLGNLRGRRIGQLIAPAQNFSSLQLRPATAHSASFWRGLRVDCSIVARRARCVRRLSRGGLPRRVARVRRGGCARAVMIRPDFTYPMDAGRPSIVGAPAP
jgi:hypothetical protein